MAETYQEKTEKPTEKRIEDARKKGQVALSREIPASFLIIVLSVFMYFSISRIFCASYEFFVNTVGRISLELDLQKASQIGIEAIYFWAKMVVPFFCVLIFVSIFSYVMQTGFIFTTERLKFNLQNLNPLEGIKKLISKRSLVELIKSLIKITVLTGIVFSLLKRDISEILCLLGAQPNQIVSYTGLKVFLLTLKLGFVFALLALGDYFFQRWQYIRDLMMTRQELKEEYKEREGDPLVKSRIRAMQKALARRRMIEEVKTADVIITNPTHLAVALKYEIGKMPAPRVVAKGQGFIAEKIKEVARKSMIPIIENKLVAQALYFSVDVGDYIPEKFYLVVAEILAQVYRMKGRIVN